MKAETVYLQEIHRYPVKSLAGNALSAVDVFPQGLAHDREWLIADAGGNMVTARRHPHLLLWQSSVDAAGTLEIAFPDGSRLYSRPEQHTQSAEVAVWKDRFPALHGHTEADRILSAQMEQPVRLYWLGRHSQRLTAEGTPLSFADGAPFLLTARVSLDELNRCLGTDGGVEMAQFRANLVVDGLQPYQEEDWQQIRIGSVRFEQIKPCVRCVMTTVNLHSGIKHPQQQPLAYLARHRRAIFGINLRALDSGRIQTGDEVRLIA